MSGANLEALAAVSVVIFVSIAQVHGYCWVSPDATRREIRCCVSPPDKAAELACVSEPRKPVTPRRDLDLHASSRLTRCRRNQPPVLPLPALLLGFQDQCGLRLQVMGGPHW